VQQFMSLNSSFKRVNLYMVCTKSISFVNPCCRRCEEYRVLYSILWCKSGVGGEGS
jgi:hypothetical protein